MLTFIENSQYRYAGFVTGPFKVHKSDVTLTYKGDHFEALLLQEGQELTFDVAIQYRDDAKMVLKSEPFMPPTNSDLTNMTLICTAEITEDALTGIIEIPTYSATLSLNFQRV